MAAGSTSESKKEGLAWSGTVEQLYAVHDCLQRQADQFIGPFDPGDDEGAVLELRRGWHESAFTVEVTLEDSDLNTVTVGTLSEVLGSDNSDIRKAVGVEMTLGGHQQNWAKLTMKRDGFRRGITLQTRGDKREILSLEANVWREVEKQFPWWSVLRRSMLEFIILYPIYGLFVAIGTATNGGEDLDFTPLSLGLVTSVSLVSVALSFWIGSSLRRFVFPAFEVHTPETPPRSKRLRAAAYTGFTTLALSVIAALLTSAFS